MAVERGPILVWGAGAIGGTIGAHLVRAGEDVTFVDRDRDHVAAMKKGLGITGPMVEFTVPAKAVTADQLQGRLRAGLPLRQGPGYGRCLARLAAPRNRGRLRRLGPERAQRAHHRQDPGRGKDHGLLRQFRRRLHGAGRDPLCRSRLRRHRRDRRQRDGAPPGAAPTAAQVRGARSADPKHLGLSLGQARLWRAC